MLLLVYGACFLCSAMGVREGLRSLQSPARGGPSRVLTTIFAAAALVTNQMLVPANALEMAPAAPAIEEVVSAGVDKGSGLFRRCSGACLSSQDDTPAYFIPPLCYDGAFERMQPRVVEYLQTRIPNARIVSPLAAEDVAAPAPNRYIRALVQGGREQQQRITDDFELYFTPNDNTIQFRIQHLGQTDFGGVNRRRIEQMVRELKLDYVPVLRNRRQQWWSFGLDTPFDEFGPSLPMSE